MEESQNLEGRPFKCDGCQWGKYRDPKLVQNPVKGKPMLIEVVCRNCGRKQTLAQPVKKEGKA